VIMPSTISNLDLDLDLDLDGPVLARPRRTRAARSRGSPHSPPPIVSPYPQPLIPSDSCSVLNSRALLDRSVLTSTARRAESRGAIIESSKRRWQLAIPPRARVVCDLTHLDKPLSVHLSRACTAPFGRPRTDQPTDLHPSYLLHQVPATVIRRRLLQPRSRQSTVARQQ
jgi:hypothetical protein